jgi:hypothetical protein
VNLTSESARETPEIETQGQKRRKLMLKNITYRSNKPHKMRILGTSLAQIEDPTNLKF